MSENNRIIKNINATMSMENIQLLKADKESLKKRLEGKVSYQDAIDKIIK